MKKVLITGGTGMLGTCTSRLLKENGYEVCHLSRSPKENAEFKAFKWSVKDNYIDPKALENTYAIVHLAGAGIADERWSKERKKLIINSRVKTLELLKTELQKLEQKPSILVSASGIGYYGMVTQKDAISEESLVLSDDFLSQTCVLWEGTADKFSKLGLKVSKLRFPAIMSKNSGAFPKISAPIKNYVGAAIGNGKQAFPWVHEHDAALAIIHSIENILEGAFNVASTDSNTQKEFTKILAKTLKKPIILPPIPSFMMKLIFGEMAQMLLEGSPINSNKIRKTGWKPKYDKINDCFEDLVN